MPDYPRIVFMGTPDFAVESLKKILENNFNVVGVITSPDKPAGRGQKLNISSVKKYAQEKNLNILQPENLKDTFFLKELKKLDADLQIVVAFRMLPKEVWELPKLGTFNLHSSLLPNYRGSAPINWAIINGEEKTGVSTFFIDEKIDTGDILLRKEVPITNQTNVGELHDKLMITGADLVIDTIKGILKNNIKPIKQSKFDLKNINPAPKIFKEDCKINWNDSLINIYNKIRGLNPYPTAWCNVLLNNKEYTLKIFDCSMEEKENNISRLEIITESNHLLIKLKDGNLKIHSLQLSSKNKMNEKDFINGLMQNTKNIEII